MLKIPHLKKYAIIGCSKCKELAYCRTDRKSFTCRKCGYRIMLNWLKLKALYTMDSPDDAVITLQNYKMLREAGKLWKRTT